MEEEVRRYMHRAREADLRTKAERLRYMREFWDDLLPEEKEKMKEIINGTEEW